MIINDAGENIYVEELEEDFAFLKDVTSQYAAVGVNNRPILAVSGSDEKEDLLIAKIADVNRTLPHYKRVENVYVVSEKLPVTSKNEVDRKAIEETITLWKRENADSVRTYNLRKMSRNIKA
jgi:acyl-CoA synthetase (AMP-forming)/AMP-acid ligase II